MSFSYFKAQQAYGPRALLLYALNRSSPSTVTNMFHRHAYMWKHRL
jgi:hypothetical protein